MLKSCGISVSLDSSRCSALVNHMFVSSIRPSLNVNSGRVAGELFFCEGNMIAIQSIGSGLWAWEARPHNASSFLEDFCCAVTKAARITIDGRRLRGMRFDWQVAQQPPLRGALSRNRTLVRPITDLSITPAELSEETAAESRLLVNRKSRDFLLRLAQLGKARSVDAQADVEAGHVKPLLERGLVRKEFLVMCRQDSRTLCTIEDKSELENESGRRFRCSICGRPFSGELIQDIFALTERARGMLNGSHWMVVWITSILVNSGIPIDQISWGATAGDDEIDIIARIHGQVIFFELKDRMFGLGDAYPFTARVQRYGAHAGLIISTEGIAEEVKKFIKEQARSLERSVYTISSEAEVRKDVPRIVDEIATSAVIESFKRMFIRGDLDPTPILREWSSKR